ncbi:MAG: hypothetical protein IJ899_07220 [Blautia sp.]|nr:hypothetical protein [Blautia sp.]
MFSTSGKPTLDEASKDGWYKTYTIKPEDFGMESCEKSDLRGGTPEENAVFPGLSAPVHELFKGG